MVDYRIFIITAIIAIILFVSLLILLIYSLILFIKFANLGISAFTMYIEKNGENNINL